MGRKDAFIRINRLVYKIFFWFFGLSALMLIVMTVVVNTSFASSLRSYEINFHTRSADRTREQFDLIMGIIESTARTICSREEITRALSLPSRPDDGTGDFSMNSFLQAMREVQPFLGNVTVAGSGGQFYSSNVLLERNDYEALWQYYESRFNAGLRNDYFVEYGDSGLAFRGSNRDVLTGVWPIYDYISGRRVGQLYVGLNFAFFQEMFIISPIINNEEIIILDSEGKIVYAYPALADFEPLLQEYPALRKNAIYGENQAVITEGKVHGVDSIIATEASQVVGWRFITIKPVEYVTGDTTRTMRIFIIVFVISILTGLVLSAFISYHLTKPIKLLADACKRIENGERSFRVTVPSHDELGQLGRTFNLMMDELNADFERRLVDQKRQNELKLDVLRAQINPHFLYNTLDSIRFLANLQEIHNIAFMCSSLINLLKYDLSASTVATLGEEIESVRNYVAVQKYRYGDIFEYHTEIEKGTETMVIPRFILQPLVENSLIHGFDDLEEGGLIVISSRLCHDLEGMKLRIEVADNGRGEDLALLNDASAFTSDGGDGGKGRNIGIRNIRERIFLQSGGKASLTYTGGPGHGTVAVLLFEV